MPPDILTGSVLLPGTQPPGKGTDTVSDPASSAGLSALFAALLNQSSLSPKAGLSSLALLKSGITKKTDPAQQGGKTDQQTQETRGNTLPISLPILAPPLLPIQMRPINPPTAGVAAGTQNAMDTVPVSGFPPRKGRESLPGGELPLQEARASESAALPVFSGFLILTQSPPSAPASAVKSVAPIAPASAPTAPASAPTAPALSAGPAVAASPTQLQSPSLSQSSVPVRALTAFDLTAPSVTAASPQASTSPQAAAASSAVPAVDTSPAPRAVTAALPVMSAVGAAQPPTARLTANTSLSPTAGQIPSVAAPKTFSLTATEGRQATQAVSATAPAPGSPVPTAPVTEQSALGQAVVVKLVPSSISERIAAPVAARSYQATYQITSQVLPVPATVIAPPPSLAANAVPPPAVQNAVAQNLVVTKTTAPRMAAPVEATEAIPIEPTFVPGKTSAVTLPSTPGKTPITAATLVANAPVTATEAVTATAGKASPAVRSDPASVLPVPAVIAPAAQKSVGGAPGEAKTKTPENALKSSAVYADNNTGIQFTPAQEPTPAELSLQVIGMRSARRAADVATDQAAPLPAPATVAPQLVTKPTESPLTPDDRSQMVAQVADGIGTMRLPAKPGGTEQMTLQLHPKDWGQLQVAIRVVSAPPEKPEQRQVVTAHIVAETPQVKAALENGASDLRHTLREAGLHLDRLTVTVQSANTSAQAGTASSGGHHLMNGGSFGQNGTDSGTGSGTGAGAFSFSTSAGNPQGGGRQGGQPPSPQDGAYALPEGEQDETPLWNAPSRLALGRVDTRA